MTNYSIDKSILVSTVFFGGITSGTSGVAEAARRAESLLNSAGINSLEKLKPSKSQSVDLFVSAGNADLTGKIFLNWRPDKYASAHVGFWAWELENFPKYFLPAAALVDEIWTNSNFARRSISAATDVPVRVFPIPSIAPQGHSKRYPSSRKKFIVAFDYKSDFHRKNPISAVRAFIKAFGNSPAVQLEIKVSNSKFNPKHHLLLLQEIAGAKNISIFEKTLDSTSMQDWLSSAYSFVSLHRSEGYGLNIVDSMALGIPTITTGYSANLEYQTAQDSLLIPFKLKPVHKYGPWSVNSFWAEPSVDAAAEGMESLAESKSLWGTLSEASSMNAKTKLSKEACLRKLVMGMEGTGGD